METHGGDLVASVLVDGAIDTLFTLSGGHIFPIIDGCARAGIRLVETRHEQSAVFGAEGLAKLTRNVGVAAVTAGPGVTNSLSAIVSASLSGVPLVVLGGRAADLRWGSGALQELDHVPLVQSVAKLAATVHDVSRIPLAVHQALSLALAPHRGPVFLDFPLETLFGSPPSEPRRSGPPMPGSMPAADGELVRSLARRLATATQPVLVAGSDVWWGRAEESLRAVVEAWQLPTVTNGLGRGCLPSDHPLSAWRARSLIREADLVVVVGTPLDFRLGFGDFGGAEVVHLADSPEAAPPEGKAALQLVGDLAVTLGALADAGGVMAAHRSAWLERLRAATARREASDQAYLEIDTEPIHPARLVAEIARALDADGVFVGDGGDCVSWAGRLVPSRRAGCWLDPGPYGCLGTGPGYLAAARLAHPDRQALLLAGDGALGFAAADLETLARHRLGGAVVVANNGTWGLELHSMRELYQSEVATRLSPDTDYGQLSRALGGAGETVRRPSELASAIRRALASSDVPWVLNVLCDPEVAYPRSTSLGI